MEAHKGPVIDALLVKWLNNGGPFPPTFDLITNADGSKTTYEIADRDELGFVQGLLERTGKKGFVLRVTDSLTKRDLAAKFCIPSDYQDKSPSLEVELASKLKGGGDFIHLLATVGRASPFPDQPSTKDKRDWVCFLSDWLDGTTLKDYIDKQPEKITPMLVAKVAETLISAVLFLELKGYKHDDLHLANIMLVDTDPDRLAIDPTLPPTSVKIIDLGSVKALEKDTKKADDDWSSIAKCLAQLHNHLHRNRAIASRHTAFLTCLRDLIEAFADDDPGRHFPEPSMYVAKIKEAANTLTMFPRPVAKFHPFEAISAEHLASDELLLQLFVDHLPWISMLQNPEPSVLVGPRGCGKSMVFRHLSIRTHVSKLESNPSILDALGFFGVYIGCASDLQNDLLWISREKDRAKRLGEEITTYFNLVLARELFRSLAMCASNKTMTNALEMTEDARIKLSKFVTEQIGESAEIVRVAGMDPLQAGADMLDRLRLKVSKDLLDQQKSSIKLSPTFIREICRHARTLIPGLKTWRIAFLLDDYTSHRLSPEIQSILNTVLWQRDESHVFKVSSEPYGFISDHVDNVRIDVNREYALINAGELSIPAEREGERRKFITNLLDKRLEAAEYLGKTESLIGSSEFKHDNELAAAIRSTKGARAGQKSFYYGIHVLSNAWSGDVSTILHMVREMFARAAVDSQSNKLIPDHVQHKAITKVSTALRERVSAYHPFGAEMSKILSSYGELAKKLLVDAPTRRNKDGKLVIQRRYRIEMSLPSGIDLDDELRNLANGENLVALKRELIRRAIFIELPPSRGKESASTQTVRWQLRSSLLPSFGTSLLRKDYIDVKHLDDFAELLTNPQSFANKAYIRYSHSPDSLFGDLFSEEEE
ncbi:protein kinase family protein [Pseudomonas alliivorans]|nr:protein kinase family protein [Pseudomonas alliivorans]